MDSICPLCKEVMNLFSAYYPVELDFSHRVCFTCCSGSSPQDLLSVLCKICNKNEKVKYENDLNRI